MFFHSPQLAIRIERTRSKNLLADGVSPAMLIDQQRITGAISTVRGDHYYPSFPVPNRRFEITGSSGPAGVDRPSPLMRTKVRQCEPISGRRCGELIFKVAEREGVLGNASENLLADGVSPSMPTDQQRVTGRISTVRAKATGVSFPVPNRRFEITHRWQPAGVDPPSPQIRTKRLVSTRWPLSLLSYSFRGVV